MLKDVSFVIEPGQKIAFVGATGAGKSSILNLIGRYYDVQKGAIRIDGVESTMKVQSVSIELKSHDEPCGSVKTDGKKFVCIAVADGYVSLRQIQLAGKKSMSVCDWLRGFHHSPEIIL